MYQLIHIHLDAPSKPPEGAPCNGCGVCCLAEPCPVGMLVSRRRTGACQALRWSDEAARYHCGLMLAAGAGRSWPVWRHPWRALGLRWVRRLISAGRGCDASLEVGGRSQGDQPSL